MLLTEFIKTHRNWEELLTEPPYCIRVKREDGYVIFSYNQIESDFNNALVRECRGIILEEGTWRPVCVPFYKFGNYGESYAPQIDWSNACTQEKIDGSLIKVWYDKGAWHVSTSGTISADNATLNKTDLFEENCTYETYGDLFAAAAAAVGLDFDRLNKDCTYMFELVGPYNKVVILYDTIDLYHIGTRNNITLQEENPDIGIKKPKTFALGSLDACVAAAKALPTDKEGYVVVDAHYNRVKVKNPAYVALHRLKNNGDLSLSSLIAIVRENETEEFLTYFPECKNRITECMRAVDAVLAALETERASLAERTFATQKDFALAVKDKPLCKYYFDWRRYPELTPKAWFWSLPDDKIKAILAPLLMPDTE